MAGVNYDVNINFLTSGSANLDKPLAKLKDLDLGGKVGSMMSNASAGFGQFNSMIDSVASKVISTFEMVGKVVGASMAGAMTMIVHEGFKFNEHIESATIGIGTILSMNGKANNLDIGMNMAKGTLADMRKDAAALPGEFGDLVNIFQMVAPAASQLNMSLGETEKLAARTMAASAVLGINMSTAGREMGMLLSGHAISRMPLVAKLGLGDSASLNKMSSADRLALVNRKLQAMDPAFEKFQGSWSGLKTSAISDLKAGAGFISTPLFEDAKQKLQKLMSGSRWGMEYLGNEIGQGLKNAFDKSYDFVTNAVERWRTPVMEFLEGFKENFKLYSSQFSPLLEGVGHLVDKLLAIRDPIGMAINLAREYGAIRVGTGIMEKGLGMGASIAPALIKAGGATGLDGVLAAAAPLAAALGIIALAAYGFIEAFTDVNATLHEAATGVAGDFMQSISHAADALQSIKTGAEVAGIGIVESASLVIDAYALLGDAANGLQHKLLSFTEWLAQKLYSLGIGEGGVASNGGETQLDGSINLGKRVVKVAILNVKEDSATRTKRNDAEGITAPNHTTHIHHVEIKVNSNQDPSRIAKETFEELLAVARHPRVSPDDPRSRFER